MATLKSAKFSVTITDGSDNNIAPLPKAALARWAGRLTSEELRQAGAAARFAIDC